MQIRRSDVFTTIRTEGAILPADLLQRIAEGDRRLEGLTPEDYHLAGNEKLNEAANRSWNRLLGAWLAFKDAAQKLRPDDPGTSVTRERWLLILFQELGYGRLQSARAAEIDGKSYPISHFWNHVPLHLVGLGTPLDRRTAGVAGAARSSPHSLVQEYLNRAEGSLWGMVSNGLKLRILRDNVSLTRQAYVEFDLEAMMDGEVYSDFALLWLLCHESRFEGEKPDSCRLEKWSRFAQDQGTRALDQLRDGVAQAIEALGRGFLHKGNVELRDKLRAGALDKQDYYRELLRLVYRLLFLFVAEDRELLLHPSAGMLARERYVRYYSTARLRRLAEKRRGSRHTDLFESLRVVMSKLGKDDGCPELALPALGSFLFSTQAISNLESQIISNDDFLDAIRALAVTSEGKVIRLVDYKNLGSEELGSVYESLLELHPELNLDAGTFSLSTAGGHERKTTGSYYTPTSLITCLLDSALDPVLEEACKKPEPEKALLALKVCDPACGSGHFLIAAAHRMARRLAAIRTGDEEPAPEAIHTAVRDVIGHCVYGVDVNEMGVELCKVALWMEAIEPGKPLSFLDHRIRCGNSLLGVTPALLEKGIPDEAFQPIEGDDKSFSSALKKLNKVERNQMSLPLAAEDELAYGGLADRVSYLDSVNDDSISGVHQKEESYTRLSTSEEYRRAKLLADAWSAAFVWKKRKDAPQAVTYDILRRLRKVLPEVPAQTISEIERLTTQYNFFHWHLVFPDVFRVPLEGRSAENPQTGWNAGFDVILGNPPWERIKLQEQEYFALLAPDIANAANAVARKKAIVRLEKESPELWWEWKEALRRADGELTLVRNSGRYPMCGCGDINTYSIFAELNRSLAGKAGCAGCIVPTGIATDATTQRFFQDLMETQSLRCLFGFENEGKLFSGVDHRVNFCVLVVQQTPTRTIAEFAAFLRHPEVLKEKGRRYLMSAADIALLNPNSRTCPVFRSDRDAEITKAIYRRIPVLWKEGDPNGNPWSVSFRSMFHMSGDSGLFRSREELAADGWQLEGNVFARGKFRMLPLYEAKMVYHFNHRFGDFGLVEPGDRAHILPTPGDDLLAQPDYVPMPRYWVDEAEVAGRIDEWWSKGWFTGWRDVTDPRSSFRTVVPGIIPRTAVSGKFPLLLTLQRPESFLFAILSSFVLDYIGRQKIGGVSLSMFVMRQLPILPPSVATALCNWMGSREQIADFVRTRVLELTYTAWDLKAFAQDCGWSGPPFRWDEERRFVIRCELDAAFFHLYGINRVDVDYIMDTFPIVRRKDDAKFGEYRTKRVILEIYDALTASIRTGQPYQTRLYPPPGPPIAGLPDWHPGEPRAAGWPSQVHPPRGCHD